MSNKTDIPASKSIAKTVDHFFRHESAKVISHLTHSFGTKHFEIIEDAVQEALIKAMQQWSYKSIPANPSGWIVRVAKNRIIDTLRRDAKTDFISAFPEGAGEVPVISDSIFQDDQLKMIFACCHPSLSAENQIILILKILCGFGKHEIARALLKKEDTIAKAYTRSKKKLRGLGADFVVPAGKALEERLQVVLKIIYLLFSEGYSSSSGEELIKKDVCIEAIRLARLLLDNDQCVSTEVHSLMALMSFHAARFDSRTNAKGELQTIAEQDRNLWEKELIIIAQRHMNLAITDGHISSYFVQASIAGCHCLALDYASTDWKAILDLYSVLLRIQPNPVAALNRVVAFSKVHGAKKGLAELAQISGSKELSDYHLFHAIKAELLTEVGQNKAAIHALQQAIGLTPNQAEKKYLNKKLSHLKNG